MRFVRQNLEGLWLLTPDRIEDERGSFTRTFCRREFEDHGLETSFAQHSLSVSRLRHTIRGLHFQVAPDDEVKLVSCVRGEIFDVAVDLRPGSSTYLQWAGAILSETNGAQFYIPKGFAHGFQSLCADVAVSYMISAPYAAASARGLRYDDPALAIDWPAPPSVMSSRDREWKLLAETAS